VLTPAARGASTVRLTGAGVVARGGGLLLRKLLGRFHAGVLIILTDRLAIAMWLIIAPTMASWENMNLFNTPACAARRPASPACPTADPRHREPHKDMVAGEPSAEVSAERDCGRAGAVKKFRPVAEDMSAKIPNWLRTCREPRKCGGG